MSARFVELHIASITYDETLPINSIAWHIFVVDRIFNATITIASTVSPLIITSDLCTSKYLPKKKAPGGDERRTMQQHLTRKLLLNTQIELIRDLRY
jgi:hypothetical protein